MPSPALCPSLGKVAHRGPLLAPQTPECHLPESCHEGRAGACPRSALSTRPSRPAARSPPRPSSSGPAVPRLGAPGRCARTSSRGAGTLPPPSLLPAPGFALRQDEEAKSGPRRRRSRGAARRVAAGAVGARAGRGPSAGGCSLQKPHEQVPESTNALPGSRGRRSPADRKQRPQVREAVRAPAGPAHSPAPAPAPARPRGAVRGCPPRTLTSP